MIFDNKTRAIYKKPLFLQIKKATHRLKNLAFLVKNAVIIVCIGIARTRREKHTKLISEVILQMTMVV